MRTVLFILIGFYVFATSVYLLLQNRRPQSTVAWLLVFFFAPVIGVLIYILFGRYGKSFNQRRNLLLNDLKRNGLPLLSPLLERQDLEISKLEQESSAHRKLMMLVRRNSNSVLTTRNRVQIQQDASVFYPSLIRDIENARHSIHLQYFIWRTDAFTEQLMKLLIEKAKAGVEVRILYDPFGSRSFLLRVHFGRKKIPNLHIASTSSPYRLETVSYRNHRKITVIDGAIGYTGGMNLGQEHIDGGKDFEFWRDTQVRIVGEGAAILQSVFLVDWCNAVGENLFSPQYFPAVAINPDDSSAEVPVQILTSGPDSQWSAIRQLYSLMIVTAQHHVFIQSPYFILDGSIAEALKTAALSGVDVKVMLTPREPGNLLPYWAGNTFIAEVMEAGVKVFLYQKGYLHAKTISIDSRICSIGSANIDIRSFSINYELNAVLYHDQLARELERSFEQDLADCVAVERGQYERSNPVIRFRDSVARLLSPLL